MKRRIFLLQSGTYAAGTILSPYLVDKVMNYIAKTGEPLLNGPKKYDVTLYLNKEPNGDLYFSTVKGDFMWTDPYYLDDNIDTIGKLIKEMNKYYSRPLYDLNYIKNELKECRPDDDFSSIKLSDPLNEDIVEIFLPYIESAYFEHEHPETEADNIIAEFARKYEPLKEVSKNKIFGSLEYGHIMLPGGWNNTYSFHRSTIKDMKSVSAHQEEMNRLNFNVKIELGEIN